MNGRNRRSAEPRKVLIGFFVGLPLIVLCWMTWGLLQSPSPSFVAGILKIIAVLSCIATAIVLVFLPKENREKFRQQLGYELPLPPLLAIVVLLAFVSFASGTAYTNRRNADLRKAGYSSEQAYDDITAQGFQSMAEYRAHLRAVAAAKAKAARARALADAQYAEKEKLVVGRWLMPVNADHMITIRHNGRGYVAEFEWKNGDKMTKALREHGGKAGKRFDLVDDVAGTYYVVLPNGDLDIRDKDGEVVHAPPFEGDARNHQAVVDALNGAEQDLLKAQDQARCETDATCAAEGIMPLAVQNCRGAIEQRARYDFKWTDGLFSGPMFLPAQTWHGKRGRERRLIDFFGDKVKLENGFGAWANYKYRCTVKSDTGEVVDVELRRGRFPGSP